MKAYSTFTNFTRGVFPLIILSLLAGLTACQRKTPEQDTGQAATQAAEATTETASNFPVTFKHIFGETTIKSEPRRIISLSFGRADTLWALGVKPIAVRYSYGDYEYAAWPWIKKVLGDNKPFVINGQVLVMT